MEGSRELNRPTSDNIEASFLFHQTPTFLVWLLLSLGAAFSSVGTATAVEQRTDFDIAILNGHIVDGSGTPWYSADVGIRDDRLGI